MELFFGLSIFTVIVIALFVMVLPIACIIHIVTNQFHGNDKIVWILVVLLFPFLGSVLYLLVGRKKAI